MKIEHGCGTLINKRFIVKVKIIPNCIFPLKPQHEKIVWVLLCQLMIACGYSK